MAETRFEMRQKALDEILGGDAVKDLLHEYVDQIQELADDTLIPDREVPGYMCAVEPGKRGRPVGHVWAQGQYAKNSNAMYNTLVKVLFSLRHFEGVTRVRRPRKKAG